MNHEEKLERMIASIEEDCRRFGMDETRIRALEKHVLVLHSPCPDNDYNFYFSEDFGYVLTFWERGFCNWGMSSFDELGFRFLFQRHIIHHDFLSLSEAEEFMTAARPLFGETREYQDAQAFLHEKKAFWLKRKALTADKSDII